MRGNCRAVGQRTRGMSVQVREAGNTAVQDVGNLPGSSFGEWSGTSFGWRPVNWFDDIICC